MIAPEGRAGPVEENAQERRRSTSLIRGNPVVGPWAWGPGHGALSIDLLYGFRGERHLMSDGPASDLLAEASA